MGDLIFAAGLIGGMQVACVNMSTSLRTKNLGKVPPRFDTLDFILAFFHRLKGVVMGKTHVASRVM